MTNKEKEMVVIFAMMVVNALFNKLEWTIVFGVLYLKYAIEMK